MAVFHFTPNAMIPVVGAMSTATTDLSEANSSCNLKVDGLFLAIECFKEIPLCVPAYYDWVCPPKSLPPCTIQQSHGWSVVNAMTGWGVYLPWWGFFLSGNFCTKLISVCMAGDYGRVIRSHLTQLNGQRIYSVISDPYFSQGLHY